MCVCVCVRHADWFGNRNRKSFSNSRYNSFQFLCGNEQHEIAWYSNTRAANLPAFLATVEFHEMIQMVLLVICLFFFFFIYFFFTKSSPQSNHPKLGCFRYWIFCFYLHIASDGSRSGTIQKTKVTLKWVFLLPFFLQTELRSSKKKNVYQ